MADSNMYPAIMEMVLSVKSSMEVGESVVRVKFERAVRVKLMGGARGNSDGMASFIALWRNSRPFPEDTI